MKIKYNMGQYISKAAVVAEIERLIDSHKSLKTLDPTYCEGLNDSLDDVLSFLNTLEVKEVDFEKIWKEYFKYKGDVATVNIKYLAKHFFELGLNSQTKDIQEALRMEYEKGRADVLRCIDPDEMVADFCSQPFSMTRSIASVYRQGIIDILKRINNNEENSITGTCSIDNCGL